MAQKEVLFENLEQSDSYIDCIYKRWKIEKTNDIFRKIHPTV